jgi:hypothetical protein
VVERRIFDGLFAVPICPHLIFVDFFWFLFLLVPNTLKSLVLRPLSSLSFSLSGRLSLVYV